MRALCMPLRSVIGLLVMGLAGCASNPSPVPSPPDGAAAAEPSRDIAGAGAPPVRITLLHLNDVYEIGPVEGGRRGGLARVATLRKGLLERNPNTFTLHAGDLLSPSAMGTAKVDGERLDGRQMIAVLNSLGLDVATFGNHEFDLDEGPFLKRLAESRFQWISANVTDASGKPFPGTVGHTVLPVPDGSGGEVRLGIIGVTIEETDPSYFRISDPFEAVRREVEALKGQVDILIALTHLSLAQDARLAEVAPELDLILGGHEHENYQLRRGPRSTPVLKGDANARSVYVHYLAWDPATRNLEIESEFVPVDDRFAEDESTRAEVERWTDLAYAGFRSSGFEPTAVVAQVPIALDGRESSVRNRPTALTDLIAQGMLREGEGARVGLFNSGSIRIDDVIPPGPVTQYDVIRVLPFGGSVVTVRMKGALLARTLSQGKSNVGIGGFLQFAGAARSEATGRFEVSGEAIDPDATYLVVVTDFLLTGREAGLGFLTPDNPDLDVVKEERDVRLVLIDQLRRTFSGAP